MNKRIRYTRRDSYSKVRLPEGAKRVDRGTKYGNPFPVEEFGREEALRLYDIYLNFALKKKLIDLTPLIGKDLACSCQIGERCHGDRLLQEVERISVNKGNKTIISGKRGIPF